MRPGRRVARLLVAITGLVVGAVACVQNVPDPCPVGEVGVVPNCSGPGEGLNDPADFSVVLTESRIDIQPGEIRGLTLYIKHSRRFAGVVQLGLTAPGAGINVYANVTVLLVPSNKSFITVEASKTAWGGDRSVTFTARGTLDGHDVERTATLLIRVPEAGGSIQPVASGLVRRDGAVELYGGTHRGDLQGTSGWGEIAALALSDSYGYWIATSNGNVYEFGTAPGLGSLAGRRLAAPIVGMERTPSGRGYWLVARDGGVFSFGDATFHGSTGGHRLNQPIVALEPTPSGAGYWLVAADGGVFTFGDATFHGSTGGTPLNQPIVGMATSGRDGYWLLARDGGIFSFGANPFKGSAVGNQSGSVGLETTIGNGGYWVASSRGSISGFGSAADIHGWAEPTDSVVGFDTFH